MRLDVYLCNRGLYPSRNKAAEAIARGDVRVNSKIVLKPSQNVSDEATIEIVETGVNFVSNGGYKLQKAFDDFDISVDGAVCVDVGASNGGFTDCLLRHGAKKVFAVDVGESQLEQPVLGDERVVVMDNFNARNLSVDTLGEYVDAVTCDVSFISLTYVLQPIYAILKSGGIAITLIKPQFECGKKSLNKNGLVTNEKDRLNAISKIKEFAVSLGFRCVGVTNAPIKPNKNVEYLALLSKEV